MNKIAFVAALGLGLVACEPVEPTEPPEATATVNPDPCGDGTVLGENEECP